MNNSEQKDILPPNTYGPFNALEKFRQAMLDYPECVGMVRPSEAELKTKLRDMGGNP